MYVLNNRLRKYMREQLINLQGEIGESTIIVVYVSTPLSEMDGSNRQKISKDKVEINSTINHLDMTDYL